MAASPVRVSAARLGEFVAGLFQALGLPVAAAKVVAEDLVASDLEGIASHGVMLVPMYADRIRAGSVSLKAEGRVVSDRGSALVLDGENALGQLTAHQAVQLAGARARDHGLAAVAVRNAFHFGTAGRWAQALAARGCVGIVMCNTRPLMPAPGGAERVVGNNPMAIAVPSADGPPLVLDMATSATAMGKIRLADAAGRPIPDGWAVDAEGRPTTDAATAIKGMLLPAAGPKGFGLAFMIDLLCGGLSAGAVGDAVQPLYGDPAVPYASGHFFLAIDVGRFRDPTAFAAQAGAFASRVRGSKRAPGAERLYSPGEPAWQTRQANGADCPLAVETIKALAQLGARLGVPAAGVFPVLST